MFKYDFIQSNPIIIRIILIREIPSLALLEVGPGDSVWDVGPEVYGIRPGVEHLNMPQRCISRTLSHLVAWISLGGGFDLPNATGFSN